MVQEKALTKLTTNQAVFLLKKAWPGAPDPEVMKAAIICHNYNLHPYMGHVFLIPFKRKSGETTWSVVHSIKSKRLIAQQGGKVYGYHDGPRVMTGDEQVKLFSKVEPHRIWAITILKDSAGNLFPGYGFWDKDDNPYGSDKGNTQHKMAFIRSESDALHKLAPGQLPNIEVVDDSFMETTMAQAVEDGKAELVTGAENDINELWPEDAPRTSELTRVLPEELKNAIWKEESQAMPATEEGLLAWVCEAKGFREHKTARAFLINAHHIAPESLAKDPAGVFVELRGKIESR